MLDKLLSFLRIIRKDKSTHIPAISSLSASFQTRTKHLSKRKTPPGPYSYSRTAIRLRYIRGLSQRSLAAIAGISPSTISRFEAGKTRPKSTTVASLANGLGISPDAFLMLVNRELNKLVNRELNKFSKRKEA